MTDKEGILDYFISDNNKTVTTTSLLDLGVNIPSIDTMLYIGILRLLKDYTQKSRKTGHDKKVSQAIIFLNNKVNTPMDKDKDYKAALLKYI